MRVALQLASLARQLVHPLGVTTHSVGCSGIRWIVDSDKPFTHHHLGRRWLSCYCWQWSPLLACLKSYSHGTPPCHSPVPAVVEGQGWHPYPCTWWHPLRSSRDIPLSLHSVTPCARMWNSLWEILLSEEVGWETHLSHSVLSHSPSLHIILHYIMSYRQATRL